MEKFFSVFGKIILVVIVVGGIGIGAYYLGTKNKTANVLPTPTVQVTSPTNIPTNMPTVTPKHSRTAVSAGLGTLPAFSLYVLSYPSGWTSKEEKDEKANTDKLTLTKENYTLTILQGPAGAGPCTFGNEPAQEMAQHFATFVGIVGFDRQFRRGTNDSKTYTVCEQKVQGYAFPTAFGYITYTVPNPSDKGIMAEADSIIASIMKQH